MNIFHLYFLIIFNNTCCDGKSRTRRRGYEGSILGFRSTAAKKFKLEALFTTLHCTTIIGRKDRFI